MSETKKKNTAAKLDKQPNPITTPVVSTAKYEAYYAELLPEIIQVPHDAFVTNLSMPIDEYIKEAEQLKVIVNRTMDGLKARKFKDETLTALIKRTGATRIAQINMQLEIKNKNSLWKQKQPVAFDLRDTLLAEFKFACRDIPERIEILKDISKGATISDMIHDLYELAKFGETVLSELEDIAFDMDLIAIAKDLSEELGEIQVSAKLDRNIMTESRIIREQAVVLLHESVTAIKAYGEFVFRKDPKTADLFKSAYLRTQYTKTKKQKEEATDTSPDEASENAA